MANVIMLSEEDLKREHSVTPRESREDVEEFYRRATNKGKLDAGRTVRSGYAYDFDSTDPVSPRDAERAAGIKAELGDEPLHGIENRYAYRFVKRAFDIAFSAAVIVAFSWLFVIIAIAIKVDDPKGPVFFKQLRCTKGNRQFYMLKFRSMCVDAEEKLAELQELNEKSGPVFKIADDPRITRVGKWLRKLSLDELPQFINVLKCANAIAGHLDNESAEFLQRISKVFLGEEPSDEFPDADGVEQAEDRDTLLLALAETYYRMHLFDFAARHFRACRQRLNPVAQLHCEISETWSDMGMGAVLDAKARAIGLLGAFPLWACDDDLKAYSLAVQVLSEGLPEDDVGEVVASAPPEARRLLGPLELLVELRSCSAWRVKEICEIGFQNGDLSLAMASIYRLRSDLDGGLDMLRDLFGKWPEAKFLAIPVFKCYLEVSRPSVTPDDIGRWRSLFDDSNLFDLTVGNYLRKEGNKLHEDLLESFIDQTASGNCSALLNEPREAFEAASALGRTEELIGAVGNMPLLPVFAVPGLMTQLVNSQAPNDIVERIIERYGEALSQSPEFVEDCAVHYHNAKRYRRALDSAIAAFGLRPSRLAAEVCLHASLALGEKLAPEVESFVIESNCGDLIAQASRLARVFHNASRADSLIMRALLCEDPSCPDAMLEYISACHGEDFSSSENIGGNMAVLLEEPDGGMRMLAFHNEMSDLPDVPTLHGGYEHLSVGSAEYQSLRGKAPGAVWEWHGVRYKVALVEDLKGVMLRYCLANSGRIPGAKMLYVDPDDPESLFSELRKLQGNGIDRREILAEGIEARDGEKFPVGFWSAAHLFGMNPVELAIKLVHDAEVPIYRYPANRRYNLTGERSFLLSPSAIVLAALAKLPESVLGAFSLNAIVTARTKVMITGCVESFIARVEESSGYLEFNSDGAAWYSETTPEAIEFLKRDTDAILSLLDDLHVVDADDPSELIADELGVFDPVVQSDIGIAKSLSFVYVTEDYWECRVLEELNLVDWCDLQALLGSYVNTRHDEMTLAIQLANLLCVPSFDGPLRDWMTDSRWSFGYVADE